jgi:hypothetical protein
MNAQVKPKPENPMKPAIEIATNLYQAFARAQEEMQNPAFDAANPHFKSRFASLAAVRNAVIPCFARHGIALAQDITSVEAGVSCVTILMHESGQERSFGPLILPVAKNDAQGFGSASTYARRYTMQSVAGVVGDDDDDGNAAVAAKVKAAKPQEDIHPDVWVALGDAAAMGEKELRQAWRGISESTRDAIMANDNAKWEALKGLARIASKQRIEETV